MADRERRRTAARRLGLPDLLVVAFLVAVSWVIVAGNRPAPGPPVPGATLDLRISLLPYYAARSVLRMLAAFALSTVFTLVYGYIAAHHRFARALLIPALDILQSVPVLGFLSVSVASFASLFPGKMTGFELASIFAIFTGQAWNMTFAFYQSLLAVPRDLRESSEIFGLSKWTKFTTLELPSSMISLVWNGMMSFGGGWFFLAASEAITVLGRDVRLPGIGSYMATAIQESNVRALTASLVTMISVIVLIDQALWRPLVAWSQKFKVELTASGDQATSLLLDIFSRSVLAGAVSRHWLRPVGIGVARAAGSVRRALARGDRVWPVLGHAFSLALYGASIALAVYGVIYAGKGLASLSGTLTLALVGRVFYLGLLTLLRVTAAVVLGMLWTIPAGVKIGMNPRLRNIAQPIVQTAASFPANMLFPFVTLLYVRYRVNFEIGAVPLMMLGTQWYLLFNVIGGAMGIPNDLDEAARIYRLRRWARWRYFILPSIFPSIVTGGITAAGGAWNASIVAEVTSWGGTTLSATGLGAFITESTVKGDWPAIVTSIAAMAVIVVLVNRLLWRRLYARAEEMRASST